MVRWWGGVFPKARQSHVIDFMHKFARMVGVRRLGVSTRQDFRARPTSRASRASRASRVSRARGPRGRTSRASRASRGSAEMHACAGLKFRAQALTRPAASVSALLLLTTYSRHSFVAAHTATAAATKHWAFRLRRCLLLGSCSCGFKAMLFMLLDLSCFLRSLFAVLGATRSPRVPALAP